MTPAPAAVVLAPASRAPGTTPAHDLLAPSLWWWTCRDCHLDSDPQPDPAQAVYLAGVHDGLHHHGQATAALRAFPTPPPATDPERG